MLTSRFVCRKEESDSQGVSDATRGVKKVLRDHFVRVQFMFESLNDSANGTACMRTMEDFGVMRAHVVEDYESFKVHGGITIHPDKVSDKLPFSFYCFPIICVHGLPIAFEK